MLNPDDALTSRLLSITAALATHGRPWTRACISGWILGFSPSVLRHLRKLHEQQFDTVRSASFVRHGGITGYPSPYLVGSCHVIGKSCLMGGSRKKCNLQTVITASTVLGRLSITLVCGCGVYCPFSNKSTTGWALVLGDEALYAVIILINPNGVQWHWGNLNSTASKDNQNNRVCDFVATIEEEPHVAVMVRCPQTFGHVVYAKQSEVFKSKNNYLFIYNLETWVERIFS